MLVELSIIPVKGSLRLREPIAEMLCIVDRSELPYQLTPGGTQIEGTWDGVMALVRECHEQMCKHSPHVFTTIKIEDEVGVENKLLYKEVSL